VLWIKFSTCRSVADSCLKSSFRKIMTLFANTIYHWPVCWTICFIPFLRMSFPYWLWWRVIPYTYFWLRAYGGCEHMTVCSLLLGTRSYLHISGGPCCPSLDFVLRFGLLLRFTHCYLRCFISTNQGSIL
jgi:hypothetical protein